MLNPWRLRLLSQLDILGTVRAVADAANLSASTVSQQLAVLEAETHTQLLERTGRRVRLTPAGLMLARRARAILDHIDTVEAELRDLNDEPTGLVRAGAFQSAIHTFAVPAVTVLARTHPHVDVELLELEPHESIPALRVGDADLIIATPDFVELPLGPDVDVVPLAADSIVLVVPAERAGSGPADLAAYAGESWAPPRGRGGDRYSVGTSIRILRSCTGSLIGTRISRMPRSYLAEIISVSAPAGSVTERLKEP